MRTEGHIAVAGAGYVGLTTSACFCEMGHHVKLVEIDPDRLAQLQAGGCPIFEPGLSELLGKHANRQLQFTDRLEEALAGARALFVCVGTPPSANGGPDLSALRRLLGDLCKLPGIESTILVLKSTVPPGTNRMAYDALGQNTAVVSNPEFLREGTAIDDFFHPDRVVVGSPDEGAALQIAGLYVGVDAPLLVTGWEEAELVKYATNAFLALKISFANEIAALSDSLQTDALDVLKGLGLDHRAGPHFLRPGPGYGGSCLPKDVKGLIWTAKKARVRLDLLPAVERANSRQRYRLVEKLLAGLGDLVGKRIAIWGLAFKAETDDLRGSAAVDIALRLLKLGAQVQAYDPVAMPGFAKLFPYSRWPNLSLTSSPMEAVHEADALLILTEWELFTQVNLLEVRHRMTGRLVVDGRNLLDPDQAIRAGLTYRGVGRGQVNRR